MADWVWAVRERQTEDQHQDLCLEDTLPDKESRWSKRR